MFLVPTLPASLKSKKDTPLDRGELSPFRGELDADRGEPAAEKRRPEVVHLSGAGTRRTLDRGNTGTIS